METFFWPLEVTFRWVQGRVAISEDKFYAIVFQMVFTASIALFFNMYDGWGCPHVRVRTLGVSEFFGIKRSFVT